MPEDVSNAPQDPSNTARASLGRDVAAGPAHTSPTFDRLTEKVSEDLMQARDEIAKGSATVMDGVEETIAGQKNFLARQISGLATALEKVGGELEGSDQRDIGQLTKRIGQEIHAIAKDLEGRDLGEIAGMAEDFSRREPVAFLGAAALAGLVASRFLTASAKRPKTKTAINSGGNLNG
ncbi:hypothetical protein FHX15_003098 [Rhizobium sp. BK650]|uniref:nutrient deprivation-induced protein n=1 Tax=Rhizobium sp. BK650 TaxID=2586990 RepID=UPI00160AFB14|nr:nutrient deprivation-induced protein [Rhizobium sp. BK650]MBB3657856.1 hypothetical protein [Rhizobium sp. BK650]